MSDWGQWAVLLVIVLLQVLSIWNGRRGRVLAIRKWSEDADPAGIDRLKGESIDDYEWRVVRAIEDKTNAELRALGCPERKRMKRT